MSTLYQIPLRNDLPWYDFKIILSGVTYTLNVRYNARMQRWILDILDAIQNPILCGIPLLIGIDFLSQYVIEGLPPGILFVTDDSNEGTQASRFSFGLDHTCYYLDPTT